MNLVLNGKPAEHAHTVADLVARVLGRRDPAGIAVAVNAIVVPGSRWADWVLRDGDVVDVVTAVQGG